MSSKLVGLGMALQEPDTLVEPDEIIMNAIDEAFLLDELNPDDKSYKEIKIDFENAGLKVTKIEKLTNAHLCKRYITERNLMLGQRKLADPNFQLNEKYLYHGTSAKKLFICEEGLDSRMSKQGCFGKGIYFSDYPKKCVKYAEKQGNEEHFILLMRVILGEPKIYPNGKKDKNLVREPEKTSPYTGYRFYDSVQGCPVNHQEFVVYENRRALVEYIISYSKPVVKNSHVNEALTNNLDTGKSILLNLRITPILTLSPLITNSTTDDDESDSNLKRTIRAAFAAKPKKNLEDYLEPRYEELLLKKKQEFMSKTGVVDDFLIDHYLLRGNMDVDQAVKFYKEKPADSDPRQIDDSNFPETLLEKELKRATARPEYPQPGSDGWNVLSSEDREAIIEGLIDDFMLVTGLSREERDYAKRRLTSSENNLDLAVVAHYEDM
ncbi:unnamed protein product [Lymnaea stagnalis]|uniref:Poly [ADP-ribose] polymerase n=1 Tax=Lymnaea stagnalis TaxID=6523 RepID=A0AAV2HCF7_LYMST